jgi:hypothetical protein
MQRKRVTVGLATVLSALGLAGSAAAIDSPQTFNVLSVEGRASEIAGFDFSSAPQAGDRFAFHEALYRWDGTKRGARMGHLEGLCTFVNESFPFVAHCNASFFLPAGQIYVGGFIGFGDGPARFDVPVLGGTGSYANVRGYVRIRDIGRDTGRSNNQFHLLP